MSDSTEIQIQFNVIPFSDFQPSELPSTLDKPTMDAAQEIVDQVRDSGEPAIREMAAKFGERTADDPLVIKRPILEDAVQQLATADRDLLQRVGNRIRDFAQAQLDCLKELKIPVPGGFAGHTIEPIQRAGCYAPAGNYALPSTVLMTCIPASVAGCETITLATPNPSNLMLATAAIAGADQVLAVGGAHAVSAMAYGFAAMKRCDVIVGPGNRWVTAAKRIVSGDVGIDMLAGPSELVLVADDTAEPGMVAADLLAQAEHDTDARPFLIAMSHSFVNDVITQLEKQLPLLPTAKIAEQALKNGGAIVCDSVEQAVTACNLLAPEHLELHLEQAAEFAGNVRHAGCVFIGHQSAEVFGDYGIGPNHTLPTSGTSRFSAGLNVFSFVRVRTFIELENAPQDIVDDTARLAELEGLIAHQRSGLQRKK
ncbi:MAG: histidinol dehydrogenase [Planctomycetota bacterium]